jgi:hypothetical protein
MGTYVRKCLGVWNKEATLVPSFRPTVIKHNISTIDLAEVL